MDIKVKKGRVEVRMSIIPISLGNGMQIWLDANSHSDGDLLPLGQRIEQDGSVQTHILAFKSKAKTVRGVLRAVFMAMPETFLEAIDLEGPNATVNSKYVDWNVIRNMLIELGRYENEKRSHQDERLYDVLGEKVA